MKIKGDGDDDAVNDIADAGDAGEYDDGVDVDGDWDDDDGDKEEKEDDDDENEDDDDNKDYYNY